MGAPTNRVALDPAVDLPSVRVAMGVPRPASEASLEVGRRWATPRVSLMIDLAARAGLRCVEIARVRSSDVERDLVGWSLRVEGKGGRNRLIPLPDDLARRVRGFADDWCFSGDDNGHLSAPYVSKLISRTLPEGVTAHMLRHRYATRAYSVERDLLAVQRLLGHASVATTQVYTRAPDDAVRRAALAAA
ncbi:tyrosine-type recombinase/integrase [Humidisolicoccus flavus]|uniref:tyrosine-type recombinase/integrase n=1 Tax=Humidisolicoccus flavus TaxID=3111414 RepID=UPI003255AD96